MNAVVGLALALAGGLVLIWSPATVGRKEIASQAATRVGHSADLIKWLVKGKLDNLWGALLLAVGFICQLTGLGQAIVIAPGQKLLASGLAITGAFLIRCFMQRVLAPRCVNRVLEAAGGNVPEH